MLIFPTIRIAMTVDHTETAAWWKRGLKVFFVISGFELQFRLLSRLASFAEDAGNHNPNVFNQPLHLLVQHADLVPKHQLKGSLLLQLLAKNTTDLDVLLLSSYFNCASRRPILLVRWLMKPWVNRTLRQHYQDCYRQCPGIVQAAAPRLQTKPPLLEHLLQMGHLGPGLQP